MDRERYQKIRSIFGEAAEVSGHARKQLLDERCGDDAELRQEVEALLGDPVTDETRKFLDPLGIADEPSGSLPQLTVPCQLGIYTVESELGRGGMGVIYRAVDTRLDRPVAVKLLHVDSGSVFEDLEREAKLLAALNHANIATIYSLEQVDGQAFFTLEFVPGQTLAERSGTLSLPQTQRVARQICLGLQAAHDRGIVHLDLKPSNVMISDEGVVKLLDFGIARSLSESDPAGQVPRGTLGYMSPEQLLGGEVDGRADLWSFGCILFECLSGTPAFPIRDLIQAHEMATSGTPPWDLLPDSTPPELRTLLERCLVLDPAHRIPDIHEVRRQLGRQIGSSFYESDTGQASEAVLPAPLTRFIGRDSELGELEATVQSNRLVTLTGTGGVGKTRLALQLARRLRGRFRDDLAFVELAPVRDTEDIPRVAATSLGLSVHGGDYTKEITAALLGQERLLVVDNCEHLLEAASEFARAILEACPHVKILATSREPLALRGEATFIVPPFETPADAAELDRDDLPVSVQFFIDRATQITSGFEISDDNSEAIAQICARLDGIPLAIELAAARLRALSPHDIAKRLDQRFGLLTSSSRDLQERQQTLRDTIDWSFRLLTDDERVLFQRLSVFVGGWTLGSAEEVCSDERIEGWQVLDLLTGLINKSLVEVMRPSDSRSEVRYRYLESVREYARDRFIENEPKRVPIEERHGDFYLQLVEEAQEHFRSSEMGRWIRRLDDEESNLIAALQRMRFRGDLNRATSLVGFWWRHWEFKGHYRFGLDTLLELVNSEASITDKVALTRAHSGTGVMAIKLGNFDLAQKHMERAVELGTSVGDPIIAANVTSNLGVLHKVRGNMPEAIRYYDESLSYSRASNDVLGNSRTLSNLGVLMTNIGEYDKARDQLEESLELSRQLGDVESIASGLQNLMILHRSRGDFELAQSCIEEALEIYRGLGSEQRIALTESNLGIVRHDQGHHEEALGYFLKSYEFEKKAGDRARMGSVLVSIVSAYLGLGDIEKAHEHFIMCMEHLRATGDPRVCVYSLSVAMSLAIRENCIRSCGLFSGAAEATARKIHIHVAYVDSKAINLLLSGAREADPDAFQEGYEAGLELTHLEAIDHALTGPEGWS